MPYTKDLFWTGGWDSTFRLLQLLFEEERSVQPHYIMRSEESTGTEIDAMANIRRYINRNYPEHRSLLKPIIITDVAGIKSQNAITKLHLKLSKEKKINKQYEILSRYCIQKDIREAELSIVEIEKEILDSELFESFLFPLLKMSKKDMLLKAKRNGWMDMMEMTSFCRRPKKGKPCGVCGPCTDAIETGLGFRLPLRSRIIGRIQLPFRRWWRNNYHKQSNKYLQWVKKLLKGRY
jgi:7-cyano-7-deazaguanine synthase in queuosine biosynthesis